MERSPFFSKCMASKGLTGAFFACVVRKGFLGFLRMSESLVGCRKAYRKRRASHELILPGAVLTESDEVLRRRSHAGAQRCSWSKAHRTASPTRAARRVSVLSEEPHQELRVLRQAADLNMALAVYSAVQRTGTRAD